MKRMEGGLRSLYPQRPIKIATLPTPSANSPQIEKWYIRYASCRKFRFVACNVPNLANTEARSALRLHYFSPTAVDKVHCMNSGGRLTQWRQLFHERTTQFSVHTNG